MEAMHRRQRVVYSLLLYRTSACVAYQAEATGSPVRLYPGRGFFVGVSYMIRMDIRAALLTTGTVALTLAV